MNIDPNVFRSRGIAIQGSYENYSPAYRQDEKNALAKKIAVKECISLVGVGTVGKTHFLNNFLEPSVLASALAPFQLAPQEVIALTIDPNALLDYNAGSGSVADTTASWAGFELIIQSLLRALPEGQIPTEVSYAYAEINAPDSLDRVTAFRQLENAIAGIFKALKPKRLVIIFDEFERLIDKMPASFFINLRALRDEHRYGLLYMTLSRKEIFNLDQDDEGRRRKMDEAQSFFELFKDPIYLRAAGQEDCIELVRSLNGRVRLGRPLSWEDYDLITSLTDGHGGLLRTVLLIFDNLVQKVGRQEIGRYLLGDPNIQEECEVFLDSCTGREVTLLNTVAETERGATPLDQETINAYYAEISTLYQKHLLNISGPRYAVAPTIFAHYLRHRDALKKATRRGGGAANPRVGGPNDGPPEPPSTLPK